MSYTSRQSLAKKQVSICSKCHAALHCAYLKFKTCLLVLKKTLVDVILLRSDLILEHVIAKKIEG